MKKDEGMRRKRKKKEEGGTRRGSAPVKTGLHWCKRLLRHHLSSLSKHLLHPLLTTLGNFGACGGSSTRTWCRKARTFGASWPFGFLAKHQKQEGVLGADRVEHMCCNAAQPASKIEIWGQGEPHNHKGERSTFSVGITAWQSQRGKSSFCIQISWHTLRPWTDTHGLWSWIANRLQAWAWRKKLETTGSTPNRSR